MKCPDCGASLKSKECDYCGYVVFIPEVNSKNETEELDVLNINLIGGHNERVQNNRYKSDYEDSSETRLKELDLLLANLMSEIKKNIQTPGSKVDYNVLKEEILKLINERKIKRQFLQVAYNVNEVDEFFSNISEQISRLQKYQDVSPIIEQIRRKRKFENYIVLRTKADADNRNFKKSVNGYNMRQVAVLLRMLEEQIKILSWFRKDC